MVRPQDDSILHSRISQASVISVPSGLATRLNFKTPFPRSQQRLWLHRNRRVYHSPQTFLFGSDTARNSGAKRSTEVTTLHQCAQNSICDQSGRCALLMVVQATRDRGCGGGAASQLCATTCIVLAPTPIMPEAGEQMCSRTSRSACLWAGSWRLDGV